MDVLLKLLLFTTICCSVSSYVAVPHTRQVDESSFPELKYLNESADPCEDFWEFSCGNYEKFNPLPPGEKIWDSYYMLQRDMDKLSVDIMGSPKRASDPKAVRKAKDAYIACMGYETYDSYTDVKPMAEIVNKLGGWPLVSGPRSFRKVFSWPEIGQMISTYGLPLFFSWSIMSYTSDADQYMIYLGKDTLALPSSIITPLEDFQEDYFEDIDSRHKREARQEIPFVSYILKIATAICKTLDCKTPQDQMKKDINDVLNVMRAISNSPNYPKKLDYNKTISTINELQEWSDSFTKNYVTRINWLEFFAHTFKNSGAVISGETKVYLLNTTSVANILELVENTNQEVIRNFVFTRLTSYMAPDSSKDMWEAYNDLYEQTYGDRYPIYERPDYCKRKVLNSQLSFALSYEYHNYFFDSSKLKNAKELISDLRGAFRDLLAENPWLDEAAKKTANTKLRQMIELIGFPDYIFNETQLDEYFKGLGVCRHDHFGNMQRLRAFNLAKTVGVVGHKRNRYSWSNSPLQVNAYYNPQNNRIVFPAAIMNPPFYSGLFSLLDYGRIGAIIGHEITHAFDSNGWNFDGEGNIGAIFSKNMTEIFKEKAKCFMDQYSKYYVDEIEQYVDGSNTLRENIADNGGLRESYKAFLKVIQRENGEISIKNYNAKQLFFIAYGTNWCKVDTKESLQIMSKDVHAPNRFRVRGPVSNMPEFSEAFGCKAGTKMNPLEKCVLW